TRSGGAVAAGYRVPSTTRPLVNQIAAPGNLSAQPVYLGTPFSRRYDFSTIHMRRNGPNGPVVITNGRLQLKRMRLLFDRTGYVETHVILDMQREYVYKFTHRVGAEDDILGQSAVSAGFLDFPIMAKNDRAIIRIISDNHVPFHCQSAEWW